MEFAGSGTAQPLTDAYLTDLATDMPVPRSLAFDELKPLLLAAGVPVDAALEALVRVASPDDLAALATMTGQPIALEYVDTFSGRTLVEPDTGAIVDVSSVVEQVGARPAPDALPPLLDVLERYRSEPAVTAVIEALDRLAGQPIPVFEYRYAQTGASVAEIALLGRRAARPARPGRADHPVGRGGDGCRAGRARGGCVVLASMEAPAMNPSETSKAQPLSSAEAVLWTIERDPTLRSTIVVVALLAEPPDLARCATGWARPPTCSPGCANGCNHGWRAFRDGSTLVTWTSSTTSARCGCRSREPLLTSWTWLERRPARPSTRPALSG